MVERTGTCHMTRGFSLGPDEAHLGDRKPPVDVKCSRPMRCWAIRVKAARLFPFDPHQRHGDGGSRGSLDTRPAGGLGRWRHSVGFGPRHQPNRLPASKRFIRGMVKQKKPTSH
jgi:hypothetical protein